MYPPPRPGQIMTETDISFLRRQAEHCIALSRATFDLTVAGRLRNMADELRARATKWEIEILSVPAAHLLGRGSSNGQSSQG
jgi:hypothetical protein